MGSIGNEMKRCADCKHCRWPAFATGEVMAVEALAVCLHPNAPEQQFAVTGWNQVWLAKEMREFTDVDHKRKPCCGPSADWFEPHNREPGI